MSAEALELLIRMEDAQLIALKNGRQHFICHQLREDDVPTDKREQIDFIDFLSKKVISLTDTSNLVIAGDWITTLSAMEKQGGLSWKESGNRNSLVYFMKEASLVDIYRIFHPKSRSYTYE